jgi:hypothetical protein
VLDEESAGLSTVADHEAFANEVLRIKSELAQPEHILVLPWNLRDEISRELDHVRSWGGRLVCRSPRLRLSEMGG